MRLRPQHVPAKWDPVRRQGHVAIVESTAFPARMGSPSDPIRAGNAVGLALASGVVFSAAFVALWPHAREAGAVLSAQQDPVALSDLGLSSALRKDPGAIERNIETALAGGDADLASSFVELAGARNIA